MASLPVMMCLSKFYAIRHIDLALNLFVYGLGGPIMVMILYHTSTRILSINFQIRTAAEGHYQCNMGYASRTAKCKLTKTNK